MVSDLSQIPRIMNDAFNQRKLEGLAQVISEDAVWTMVPSRTFLKGRQAYRDFEENWFKIFPDVQVETTNIVCSEDHVVFEFIGRGTHLGPIPGPEGMIEPTGRFVEVEFCDVLRVKGGLVVEGRSYYDSATLFRQLREPTS